MAEDGEVLRRFSFALPIPFDRVMNILRLMPQESVHRVGSSWPVGVSRRVEVDVDCLEELLDAAAWSWAGGLRAAEGQAGADP